MIQLYHVIFYQPLFNVLIFFYNTIPGHDLGLAIVALTALLRVILYPFSLSSIRSQKKLQDLQPKVEEVRNRFKGQNDRIAKELMTLYNQERVNPFSSCLPLIVQLPFLIALYRVFQAGLQHPDFSLLYSFINHPGTINHVSLGFLDLAMPSIVLAILAAISQYVQTAMLPIQPPAIRSSESKDEQVSVTMNKHMRVAMPMMTILIGARLPAGLTMYWFISTLIQVLQQWIVFRPTKTVPVV